jgi:hypothetical protein
MLKETLRRVGFGWVGQNSTTCTWIPVVLHSLTSTNQTSRMCPYPDYPSNPYQEQQWCKWSKCGVVQDSGSCTSWLGSQSFWSSCDKDPTNVNHLDTIVSLDDVYEMTFGVKPKPPKLWVFWNTVTVKSYSFLNQSWNEPRVPFLRITFVMTVSTCRYCTDKNWSWGDKVIFKLMYWVYVILIFIHLCTNWKWTKPSVMSSSFSTENDKYTVIGLHRYVGYDPGFDPSSLWITPPLSRGSYIGRIYPISFLSLHLKIETRLIDERFVRVMGECEIVTLKVFRPHSK